MSRSFSKKLMYIVVVLSILAMMIPMSIPVSAAGGELEMTLVATGSNVEGPVYAGDNDSGYNVFGSTVRVAVVGDDSTVRGWSYVPTNGYPAPLMTNYDANWAEFVSYSMTEAKISAAMDDNTTVGPMGKKWGSIYETIISQPLGTSSFVSWNEDGNNWYGSTIIMDTVVGQFNAVYPNNATKTHAAQGAILNWYLIAGWQSVDMTPGEAAPYGDHELGKCGEIADMSPARFSTFSNGQTYIQSISGEDGTSSQVITSNGAESIKIVIIPEYPGDPQIDTTPEVATYSFKKANIDAVPQLRWAGEKAILEADFGTVAAGDIVKFSLGNNSNGELSAVADFPYTQLNLTNTSQTVWAAVDPFTGMFPVAVESQLQGKVTVDATLYSLNLQSVPVMVSQQSFTVYYLQLDSLTLSDVIGKRVLTDENGNVISHKDGLWTASNPWDATLDWEAINADNPEEIDNDTRNVSTDALLRARVTGWFGADETDNPAGTIDVGDGRTINLPEGRYILPQDWALLAGSYKTRPHWDIMCDPSSLIVLGLYPTGPYISSEGLVAAPVVVGPFSPSLEVMTDTGWSSAMTSTDALRPFKTVVPDGELNLWDAPMPPAKIIFEILNDETDDMDGVGYFKDAFKEDIYYIAPEDVVDDQAGLLYTNPFYFAMIPAHEYIPATSANGWYDWDTFGTDGDAYGPYPFWQIMDPVQDVDGYPTEVEVYSDNHGEAMVYVNGDYNLPLNDYDSGIDINYMEVVGTTTIQAIADYPYFRNLQAIYSNTVQKTWTWGGQILGPDGMEGAPMVLVAGTDKIGASDMIVLDDGFTWEGIKAIDPATGMSSEPDAQGKSNKHVIWIWATDRDGMQAGVLGTKVDWVLNGAGARFFNTTEDWYGINPMYPSSELHFDANGFLYNADQPGERAAGANVNTGASWLRAPDTYESIIFNKFWGVNAANPVIGPDGSVLNPNNFAVTAIEVVTSGYGMVSVDETLTGADFAPEDGTAAVGSILRQTNFTTGTDASSESYPLDDPILLGDANLDGDVNTMDITAVERIILGMDQNRTIQADANYNGTINMGDVIRIEKIYLGID